MNIVIVGNPNCGKTTLFNKLTGSSQKVGNWPGVTVAKKTGEMQHQGQTISVVDLPGIYSLNAVGADGCMDERIACEYLLSGQADAIINIVDAANLKRHLFLTLQLLEMGVPCIVALNMWDVANQQRIVIDCAALSEALGCPVIPMACTKDRGVVELKDALIKMTHVEQKRVLNLNPNFDDILADARYLRIEAILQNCVNTQKKIPHRLTEKADAILLHRWLGIPLFLLVMYAMFEFSIGLGGLFSPIFSDIPREILVNGLQHLGFPVLAQGLGMGISTVLSFIPQIGFLFLALSFLEDSGYMARVAFVMDRLMQAIGLPGKSFIPLVIGFGCNVPAIMAARTLEHQRDRILTVMMTPFMSCGARLAIFIVFGAVFFPNHGAFFIFLLYLFGMIIAIVTGFLLRSTILKGDASPFVLEMPRYHIPAWRNLWMLTWQRLKGFVWRAGKVIVPVCVLVGALNVISVNGQSVLSASSKAITPVLAPMGIDAQNWPATVGLLTGVLAKEVVIGTLNTLYASHDFGVHDMRIAFGGLAAALSYLLFVLLYVPCVSTIAVIAREIGARWAIFSLAWSISIAYSSAVFFYQACTWSHHPLSSAAWMIAVIALQIIWWFSLKISGKQPQKSPPPSFSNLTTKSQPAGRCLGCSQNCPMSKGRQTRPHF